MKSLQRKIAIKRAIQDTADADGKVTADGVIEAARNNKNSPLHQEFNWNVEESAYEHWRAVARALIREVEYIALDVTVYEPRRIEYVHDPNTPQHQGYIPLSSAAKNRKLSHDIVVAELDRCISCIKRAQRVADAVDVDSQLAELLVHAEAVKTQLMAPALSVPPKQQRRGARAERN